MIDVDVLVSDFRAHVAEPTLSSQQIARTAVRPQTPVWRRRRVLLPVVAVSGAAVVAGLSGIFLRSEPGHSATYGTARVDWGLAGTFRLHPDQGTDPGTAVPNGIEYFMAVTKRYDIAGLRVEQTGPNRLRVTVPGGQYRNQLLTIAAPMRLRVVAVESIIATGRSLMDLQSAARATGAPIDTYFVAWGQDYRAFSEGLKGRAAAVALQHKRGGPRSAKVFGLPRGYVIAPVSLSEIALVRDESLLAGSQIKQLGIDTDRIRIQARAGARQATGSVVVLGGLGGRLSGRAVLLGQGTLEPDGVLVARRSALLQAMVELRPSGSRTLNPAEIWNLGSSLDLTDLQTFGREPLGGRVTSAWQGPPAPAPGAFFEMVGIDVGRQRARVVTGVARGQVTDAAIMLGRWERPLTTESGQSCRLGLGAPALGPLCLPSQVGRVALTVGRARPDVTSIRAAVGSAQDIRTALANGWYMVTWRPTKPIRSWQDAQIQVDGFNSSGQRVGTQTHMSPNPVDAP